MKHILLLLALSMIISPATVLAGKGGNGHNGGKGGQEQKQQQVKGQKNVGGGGHKKQQKTSKMQSQEMIPGDQAPTTGGAPTMGSMSETGKKNKKTKKTKKSQTMSTQPTMQQPSGMGSTQQGAPSATPQAQQGGDAGTMKPNEMNKEIVDTRKTLKDAGVSKDQIKTITGDMRDTATEAKKKGQNPAGNDQKHSSEQTAQQPQMEQPSQPSASTQQPAAPTQQGDGKQKGQEQKQKSGGKK